MPYRSQAQSEMIHAKAAQGVPWAVKFVRDSHGSKVPHIQHVGKRKVVKRHKRKVHRVG